VKPDDYPPAPLMKLISDSLGMLQAVTAAAIFVRSDVLPRKLVENKMVSVFGIWLGGSVARSGLTKTGAFEVYLGEKLVYSALQQGGHHLKMNPLTMYGQRSAGGEVPKLKGLIEAFAKAGVKIKS
jgi:hypothetical protein